MWVGLLLMGCNSGNQTSSQSSAQYAAGPGYKGNPLKENFEGCRLKFRVYWDRCIQNINVPNAPRPIRKESCVELVDPLRNQLSEAIASFKSGTLSAQDLGAFAKKHQNLVIQVFEHWTSNHKEEAKDYTGVSQRLEPCEQMGNETTGYVWDPGKVAGQGVSNEKSMINPSASKPGP